MTRSGARSDERLHWDERYGRRQQDEPAGQGEPPGPPDPLERMRSVLPTEGRAIDLAGGDGGGGLFLARRGLSTTVADISPIALDRAVAFAEAAGVELATALVDLADRSLAEILDDLGEPPPAVVTCCHYLSRPLLTTVGRDLPPGSRFVFSTMTTTDLRPQDRRSPRFCLAPGELFELVLDAGGDRLRVLHRREGWASGRHRAELAVQAVGPAPSAGRAGSLGGR